MDTTISINAVLAQDLLARNNQEVREKDVISLESLSSKKWDYHVPTINSWVSSKKLDNDSHVVSKRFFSAFECFRDVDMSNILVAGGSVVSCIFKSTKDCVDADLFIYGIELSEVPARIEKLIRDLRLPEEGSIVKTAFATTICFNLFKENIIIQIIHRLYTSPSEVLHGFDLGSCAVGILADGSVITTSLGKVSLEYRINILDLTKCSTTHSARLVKYFHRGFSLVLPDLDVNKIGHKSFLLDNIRVFINSIKNNKISANMIDLTSNKSLSDYNGELNVKSIMSKFNSINQTNLLAGRPINYCSKWFGKEDLIMHLRNNRVQVEGTRGPCYPFTNRCINHIRLKNILGDDLAVEYINKLINAGEKETGEIIENILILYKDKISTLIQEYNAKGGYVAQWKTVDPGSQITGSFQPRQLSKREFYSYYLKR